MTSRQGLEVKRHWETMARIMASSPPLDEQRDIIEQEWPKLTGEPGGVDFKEVDAGGTAAMWITPKGAAEERVLFTCHGGGMMSGSIYTHRKMFAHLAKAAGCRALSVEYRKTPEHAYPAAIDDTFGAYRWLLRQGIEPRHTAFVGDSSGGGLALSAVLRARDEKLPLPATVMTMSAWLDMTQGGESYQTNQQKDVFFQRAGVDGMSYMYVGPAGDRRNPHCSPLFGDLEGLPPIYLQVGADEALLDDSRQFADKARRAGVEVRLDVFPDMLHTFQMAAGRAPEADDAIRRLAQWARPRLGLPES